MFKKLLKYDIKAAKRYSIPIIIGILVAGVLGVLNVFAMKALISSDGNFFIVFGMIMSVLLFVAIVIGVSVGVSAIGIILLVDFYKGLGTDEGYLTFTLPVRARDIIFSKLVNYAIWSVASVIATIVSFGSIIITAMAVSGAFSQMSDGGGGADMGLGIPVGSIVVFIVINVIMGIVSFINSVLLYFVAIFLGTVIAKKNKGLTAVGCIVVVNMIYGTVTGVVSTIFSIFGTAIMGIASNPLAVLNVVYGIGVVLLAVVDVVFFKVLEYMMEKKLNLA